MLNSFSGVQWRSVALIVLFVLGEIDMGESILDLEMMTVGSKSVLLDNKTVTVTCHGNLITIFLKETGKTIYLSYPFPTMISGFSGIHYENRRDKAIFCFPNCQKFLIIEVNNKLLKVVWK